MYMNTYHPRMLYSLIISFRFRRPLTSSYCIRCRYREEN